MGAAPELGTLYQSVILDHYRRPRNQGEVADADARIHMNNPTCGDEIELSLRLDGERIEAIRFAGRGCSISQASASMMSELLEGKTLAAAHDLAARFRLLLHQGAGAEADRELGKLRVLAGVSSFPARMRCALLAWNAFAEALRAAEASHG